MNHEEHAHVVLFQGTEIVACAHIQFWPDHRAAIRIIATDENKGNQSFGSRFLALIEKWLHSLGIKSIHAESRKSSLSSSSLFARYLKEQEAAERLLWVAHVHAQFPGYVTLKWQSQYPSFKAQNIPEIIDLNVLPGFRKTGVGCLLLDTTEKQAATKSQIIGMGIGLYADADGGYGAAQRLYVKSGYIPDGKGVTYLRTNTTGKYLSA